MASENAEEVVKFSKAEERKLCNEAQSLKFQGSACFSDGDFDEAITLYTKAFKTCPNYKHYERAVLQSNIAACYLQTKDYQKVVETTTEAYEGLALAEEENEACVEPIDLDGNSMAMVVKAPELDDQPAVGGPGTKEPVDGNTPTEEAEDEKRVDGKLETKEYPQTTDESKGTTTGEHDHNENQISSPATPEEKLTLQKFIVTRRQDIVRIRMKALLRRARARSLLGGSQNLEKALEDYQTLKANGGLPKSDAKTVDSQLADLPAKLKTAQEKDVAEMLGKMKDLGNTILKPFGLSTNNFQMVKDEATGGYSVNFTQGK